MLSDNVAQDGRHAILTEPLENALKPCDSFHTMFFSENSGTLQASELVSIDALSVHFNTEV